MFVILPHTTALLLWDDIKGGGMVYCQSDVAAVAFIETRLDWDASAYILKYEYGTWRIGTETFNPNTDDLSKFIQLLDDKAWYASMEDDAIVYWEKGY